MECSLYIAASSLKNTHPRKISPETFAAFLPVSWWEEKRLNQEVSHHCGGIALRNKTPGLASVDLTIPLSSYRASFFAPNICHAPGQYFHPQTEFLHLIDSGFPTHSISCSPINLFSEGKP